MNTKKSQAFTIVKLKVKDICFVVNFIDFNPFLKINRPHDSSCVVALAVLAMLLMVDAR